ncbi:MAG: hypothetical protein E7281_06210 [Lachnospiraceae bacterium]|nr:hypothetical protein [Lachnospiraceae bacterium]
MKKIIKVVSVVCLACLICLSLDNTLAFAKEAENIDIIYNQQVERIVLDGDVYEFVTYLNENNERTMLIKNLSDNTEDLLCLKDNEIILNGDSFGRIISKRYNVDDAKMIMKDSAWKYWGADQQYISWAKGTTVAVVAGAIAIGLGFMGPVGVISAMGIGSLSVLASNAVGGTIYTTVYKLNVNYPQQFKYQWSFKASTGDKYGPFIHTTQI